jgi:ATP-binding cassette subfamily B protein
MITLKRFQTFMKVRKFLLPLALILSGVSALLGMIPFVLIWYIIREFIQLGSSSQTLINSYAWWAAGLAFSSIVIYFLALMCSHLAAFRVECNMRKLAMKKIINMLLGFFDKNTGGRIRKIIDDNAGITHSFLAHQMPDFASTIIIPFTAIILLYVYPLTYLTYHTM